MSLGPLRLRLLGALVVSAGALALGSASTAGGQAPVVNPCRVSTLLLRCPNLVMMRPSALHLDRTTRRGRVLLRATSGLENEGAGPVEIRARRSGSTTMVAQQAIYDSSGHTSLFSTGATLDFKYVPGLRYGYGNVGAATYWKFRYAALFQLWSIDSKFRAIKLLRTGPKLDYCLRDLVRVHRWPESPPRRVYPACSQNKRLQSVRLGTSRGWADVYPYGYPEQWIDVTGLRGRFAFVQIADPHRHIWETNEQDNISEVYVALPSARIIGYRTRASAP